jgi:hypothetical protein
MIIKIDQSTRAILVVDKKVPGSGRLKCFDFSD